MKYSKRKLVTLIIVGFYGKVISFFALYLIVFVFSLCCFFWVFMFVGWNVDEYVWNMLLTAMISWQLILCSTYCGYWNALFWEGVLHIFNITWQKDKSSHLLACNILILFFFFFSNTFFVDLLVPSIDDNFFCSYANIMRLLAHLELFFLCSCFFSCWRKSD